LPLCSSTTKIKNAQTMTWITVSRISMTAYGKTRD
jgi:hypothetical protein